MAETTITDKVATWGGGENGFGWSADNKIYIPSDELPDGITYLSKGQHFEYKFGQSADGKPRATNVQIIGEYRWCGRIVYECDEFLIVKDKAFPNYIYMKTDDNFYSVGTYVTYTMDDMEELSLSGEVFEKLDVTELKLTKIAIDVTKSVVDKQVKQGKVSYWHATKKYGFISEDGTDVSIFVNKLPDGLHKLSKFQQIEFTKHKNDKGFYAQNIKIISTTKHRDVTPDHDLIGGSAAAMVDDLTQTDSSKLVGKCSHWNNEKKCGTIDANGSKYYVHNVNIIMDGYRKLDVGQNVNFQSYTNGAGKTEAIDVKIV